MASVIAIDFFTGTRSILSDRATPNNEVDFQRPQGIIIDSDRNRAVIVDAGGIVIAMDLTDGSRKILSNYETPSSEQAPLVAPINITLDPVDHDIAYIVDEVVPNVQRIDLLTGLRNIVSDNDIGGVDSYLEDPRSILIDSVNNRAIVGDAGRLFSINLTTGLRETISDLLSSEEELPLYGARGIVSDNLAQYVLVDTSYDGIVKVDLETGARSQFSLPFSDDPIHFMHNLYLETEFSYLFYLDTRTHGVYAIDLKSAEYVVISKSQTPT